MSTSVGSIYSSIVLDDSQFTTSLRNILTTANNSLSNVSALAVKTSNSFNQIGIAAGNTDKSIKNAGNTIAGLKSKLEELTTKLESSQLGSQKFTLLKAQMSVDLLTNDLRKKRSSNQSYWLIGQPDIEILNDEKDTIKVKH
jgi:archaellum component FlaC